MTRVALLILAIFSLTGYAVAYPFDDELTSIPDVLLEHNAKGVFQSWKEHHKIAYATDEEHEQRFRQFHSMMHMVHAHNSKTDSSYKQAINRMSDLTPEEASKLHGGHDPSKYQEDNGDPDTIPGEPWGSSCGFSAAASDISLGVDWRDEGVLTPVKDQGKCGSCWAFSTTAATEAMMAMAGDPIVLSEQELTDCNQLSNHCDAGNMEEGYKWIIANGIGSIDQYPYHNAFRTNKTCMVDVAFTHRGYIDTYELVPRGEQNLRKALTMSPVATAIDAFTPSFMHYKSGLYDGPCRTKVAALGHAVLAVGFGWDDDAPYIVIRNSWTDEWGEGGYIRLRNDKNAKGWTEYSGPCGTALLVNRPIKAGAEAYRPKRTAGPKSLSTE